MVDCLRRMMGGSISLLWGGAGTALSGKLCWMASLSVSIERALVRGEDAGLSDARYVVANILSRSDSCGRSTDDFQRLLSWDKGAVLERPAWERLLRVTASRSEESVERPWLWPGAFDLTDAEGEVFVWAFGWGDMGSTLVRPASGRSSRCVADCVADIAGRALGGLARMRSLFAAETQRKASRGGLA